jgi:hypothetical protein
MAVDMSEGVLPSFVVTDARGQVIGTAQRALDRKPGAPGGFTIRPLHDQQVHEVDIPADLHRELREHGDVKRFHDAVGEHLRRMRSAAQ